MTPLDGLFGFIILACLLYFFERRQKSAYEHELKRLGVQNDYGDRLVQKIETLTAKTGELASKMEDGEARRDSALKTFLESWRDAIGFSEDERKNLRNRLQAQKLDKGRQA